MSKLSKLFLLFAFVVTSFFITGCNNSDDYSEWQRNTVANSVLLRIGIPSIAVTEVRASGSNRTVIIAGVPFQYTETASGLDYFIGYISRTAIYQALNALKFQIDSKILYVESNFFKVVLSTGTNGSQPNALLTFDQEFKVLKAESNGKEVEKPTVTENEPKQVDGFVQLSLSGDTVTAVVPSELGNVTSYYSWELRLTSNKAKHSKILYSGQYPEMYKITSDGNKFFFTLTETGKSNLDANTTYIGILDSVVVYTDKYGEKALTLTSNDSIYYRK